MRDETRTDWLVWALVAFAVANIVVWGAGALAAAFAFHIAAPTPASVPVALASWMVHPGQPGAGFQASFQRELPGPAAIYFALVVELALGTWTILALRARVAQAPHGAFTRALETLKGSTDDNGARWARQSDLRALILSAPRAPGRLIVGRAGRALVATEQRHSLLVIGPTQTGKTSGLAIPALLEWQGPVLATSVKRDLLDVTRKAREAQGPVWVYDPTALADETCVWNPLERCRSWEGAVRMAHWLVSAAGVGGARGAGERTYWERVTEKLLAPMLYCAGAHGLTMGEVLRWLNVCADEEVAMLLGDLDTPEAQDAWSASTGRDERMLSSVYTTAETVLAAYEDPSALATTIGVGGLSGERLLDGGSAYLCAPAHEQERLAPIYGALVREVIAGAYERYTCTGRPLDPPLLVLLDEAGNIAPIAELGKLAATAAGVGVQIVSVWHDLSQLETVYGKAAATVYNNHRAKLVLSGIADERTLRVVEQTLGQERIWQRSRSTGERKGASEAPHWRPLVPASVARQQKESEGILIYGAYAPARVRLRPYFADAPLLALAKGTSAAPTRARAVSAVLRRGA
ncbi:MAG: type IV secretory system conjugative DNA transfer family protein [Solirubrobacteraceae bacterium]